MRKLSIRLSKVIEYACTDKKELQKALDEFFTKTEIYPEMEHFEEITGLFNEWLIFDFKTDGGITFITEYYLRNPYQEQEIVLQELKDIIETNQYGMFQIEKVKHGEWIDLYSLNIGQKYKVYDLQGSLSVPDKSTLYCRIADVYKKWLIVGSNPLIFPIYQTERAKKIFLDSKFPPLTPKDVFLGYFKNPPSKVTQPFRSIKDLKAIQKSLEHTFSQLKKKYTVSSSFQDLVNFVYMEKYKKNFADFNIDICKKCNLPEEMLFENVQFFQDLWNYFPHKILGNKSPAEKSKEYYD